VLLEREEVNPDQVDTDYGRTLLSLAARRSNSGETVIQLKRKERRWIDMAQAGYLAVEESRRRVGALRRTRRKGCDRKKRSVSVVGCRYREKNSTMIE